MDKIKQLVDEWEFERSLINKQTENKTYNPQNHPNEFLKRNGLIFVGMLKRSGSILDKIQWH